MVNPFNGVIFVHEKDLSSVKWHNIDESFKHAIWKKWVTKDHLYHFIYMKSIEKDSTLAIAQNQRGWGVRGAKAKGYGISFWGDKSALKFTVAMYRISVVLLSTRSRCIWFLNF